MKFVVAHVVPSRRGPRNPCTRSWWVNVHVIEVRFYPPPSRLISPFIFLFGVLVTVMMSRGRGAYIVPLPYVQCSCLDGCRRWSCFSFLLTGLGSLPFFEAVWFWLLLLFGCRILSNCVYGVDLAGKKKKKKKWGRQELIGHITKRPQKTRLVEKNSFGLGFVK